MPHIETLVLGDYGTNCYIVWNEKPDCVVIDPGYEPEIVLSKAADLGLTIKAILLTHGHFDHVGGVAEIRAECDCPVYIHEAELSLPPQLTAGKIPYTNLYTADTDLEIAGLTFHVLHTPGHTPGSVCLICGDAMFAGDTLFAGSCGRMDLPGGSMAQMRMSLSKLAALTEDYAVYPGHMEATTLSHEKATNPYL